MAGATNYPGALDDFAEASPTNLGDDDATGRTHVERHDDIEAAMEAVQGTLGTTPAGVYDTVGARLDAIAGAGTASIALAAGTATAPSFYFTGDTNTGVWSPAADTLAVSTGGVERVRVDNGGKVQISDTARTLVGASHRFAIMSDGSDYPLVVGYRGASVAGPRINCIKSRGAAWGTQGIVADGDELGGLLFAGDDGTDYATTGASIIARVDGAPDVNDLPTRLQFSTTPDGASTPTERLRIDNAGLITGTGTSLGAWTAYTPTLGGTGWAIGDGTATGAYCQVGKIVHFRVRIVTGSTTTYGSASPTITTPTSAGGTASNLANTVTAILRDVSAGAVYQAAVFPFATTASTITLAVLGSSGLQGTINATTPFTWETSDQIIISGTYETA
jgi:hypothetical protein